MLLNLKNFDIDMAIHILHEIVIAPRKVQPLGFASRVVDIALFGRYGIAYSAEILPDLYCIMRPCDFIQQVGQQGRTIRGPR